MLQECGIIKYVFKIVCHTSWAHLLPLNFKQPENISVNM